MRWILFKKNLFEKVQAGIKTRTSRTWQNAPEIGDVLLSKCNYKDNGLPLRIVSVEQKRCNEFSLNEIKEEGFDNRTEFYQTLDKLGISRDALVWTMKFEVIK